MFVPGLDFPATDLSSSARLPDVVSGEGTEGLVEKATYGGIANLLHTKTKPDKKGVNFKSDKYHIYQAGLTMYKPNSYTSGRLSSMILYRIGVRYSNFVAFRDAITTKQPNCVLKSGMYGDMLHSSGYIESIGGSKSESRVVTHPMPRAFDFDALILRLTQLLCHVSDHEDTVNALFKHVDLNRKDLVIPFDGQAVPSAISNNGVFIPMRLASELPNTHLSLLMLVLISLGCQIFVSNATLDAGGSVIYDFPEGNHLRRALFNILRILGAVYSSVNAQARYNFLLFVGVNDYYSLVGHSDEGALFRDIIREVPKSLRCPTGVLGCVNTEYPYLAHPENGDLLASRLILHSILLVGAATVAVSDPGTIVDGNWYPTISSFHHQRIFESGGDIAMSEEEKGVLAWDHHKRNLFPQIDKFFNNWMFNFTKFLGEGITPDDKVIGYFHDAWNTVKPRTRHIDNGVIAPFYWVEPTSLLSAGDIAKSGCPEKHWLIYGNNDNLKHSIPAFEEGVKVGVAGALNCLSLKYSGLRRNPWIWLTLMTSAKDSMQYLGLTHSYYNHFVLPGKSYVDQSREMLMEDPFFDDEKPNRILPVTGLVWGVSDRGCNHPAEALYTCPTRLGIFWQDMVGTWPAMKDNGLPQIHEVDADIYTVVTKPGYIGLGTINKSNNDKIWTNITKAAKRVTNSTITNPKLAHHISLLSAQVMSETTSPPPDLSHIFGERSVGNPNCLEDLKLAEPEQEPSNEPKPATSKKFADFHPDTTDQVKPRENTRSGGAPSVKTGVTQAGVAKMVKKNAEANLKKAVQHTAKEEGSNIKYQPAAQHYDASSGAGQSPSTPQRIMNLSKSIKKTSIKTAEGTPSGVSTHSGVTTPVRYDPTATPTTLAFANVEWDKAYTALDEMADTDNDRAEES